MSKVKYLFYADQRGSVNGTTFSKNRFANIARSKTSPVNPDTPAQSFVRSNFGALSASFRGLSADRIDAWNAATENWQRSNVFGDTYKMTGLNLYVMLNQNLLQIGSGEIIDPPSPGELPILTADSTIGVNVLADASTGVISFDGLYVGALGTVIVPAGYTVQMYASAPISAGKQFGKNLLRFVTQFNPAGDISDPISAPYLSKFGTISSATGQRIFGGAKITDNATGQTSAMFSFSGIITA